MTYLDVFRLAKDTLSARTVYTDPCERDGVTVIAAATIHGGGGGGSGTELITEGAGFGVCARPAGAFVIRGSSVRWRPAIDVNRLIGTIGAVVIAVLITRR
ncbi:sporulation protein [Actinokineospora xionganensis]|uniref:Sporulation protein n=1 Tax=Actinokineospora xionganensis TaxID=2684470 RepID=A0ABR7LBR0_9PSEU|nr:sporulation protein [Actinokineospora xionganensis]MBC6450018.1 sporulation protein [Actinokineospora xionganensis]